MKSELVETILSITTVIISLGVGIFTTITIRDTRNKSYKEFIENREKRKASEKH